MRFGVALNLGYMLPLFNIFSSSKYTVGLNKYFDSIVLLCGVKIIIVVFFL